MSNHKRVFFIATLLNSIGNMTFLACVISFMLQAGYSFVNVGTLVGSLRIVKIFVNLLWGDLTDRLDPCKVIQISNFLCILCSLFLIYFWGLGPDYFLGFLCVGILSSGFEAIQGSASSKVAKNLSESDFKSNSRNAINLAIATQGSTLFAGLLGWLGIGLLSLEWIIAFDALTFLISAVLIGHLKVKVHKASEPSTQPSLFEKFVLFYRYVGSYAKFDFALAFVMLGANTFDARLAGSHISIIPLYQVAYGIAVWTSGVIMLRCSIGTMIRPIIFLFGVSFFMLGIFYDTGIWTLLLALIKDTLYCFLLHHISSHIHTLAPKEKMAAISSARIVQMIVVLGLGEFLVGLWQTKVSIFADALWRAVFCFVFVVMLFIYDFSQKRIKSHTTS